MKYRFQIALLLCCLNVGCLYAQSKQPEIVIIGSVVDSFTGWGVGDASVTIYDDKDSVVSKPWLITYGGRARNGNEFRLIRPRDNRRYRIHVECKNYIPTDYWLDLKSVRRRTTWTIPPIELKKDYRGKHVKRDSITDMPELVVKATKIKMYHKGDTLVYNADAFNLPEGSMLDDLIRQLPGARLTDDGEIFINGRKIDMLMLNGKDFFSNNKKVMLENLPYYTVETLKVYEESTVRSQALGHDVDSKLHVMDVRLKKEYSIGYLCNAELGGGTHETWMARLFGLRFSDNSRISVFYNGNDINEGKKPDAGGNIDLRLGGAESGLQTQHSAGTDIRVDDKHGRWVENGNVTFNWKKIDNESRSLSQTFMPDGDVFAESNDLNSNRNISFNVDNMFRLQKPFFLEMQTRLNVGDNDRHGTRSSTSFDNDRDSVNHTTNHSMGSGQTFRVGQKLKFLRNLPSGDDVEADASFNYKHETNDELSRYELRYNKDSHRDELRNRFNSFPLHGYGLSAGALYRFNFVNEVSLALDYHFAYSQESKDNARTILDALGNMDDNAWVIPPLLEEGTERYVDTRNSYSSELSTMTHRMELSFVKRLKVTPGLVDKNTRRLSINLPVTYRHDSYDYVSEPLQTVRKRDLWLFEPNVQFSWNYRISCNLTMQMSPSHMSQLIPYEYDYNPLSILRGNPNLKTQKNYILNINLHPRKGRWHFWVSSNGYLYQDRVMNSFTYDSNTGAYTYCPVNVNGTWRVLQILEAGRPLDKDKHFNFSNRLSVQYDHQVDMVASDGNTPGKSTVHTTTLGDDVSVTYSKGMLSAAIQAKYDFVNMQGNSHGFADINAHDIRYGGRVSYTFPFKLSLATSIYMYTRRGFTDSRMNTDDLVWNASIGYSFLKGRLVAHADAFDLLHQISNVTYAVDSHGRAETWNRSLPNYFLFRLQWKFSKHPKQKK